MRRALGLWGPPVAWAAAVFALSSQSYAGPLSLPDWSTHGAAYALLALLLGRALAGGLDRRPSARRALLALALATLYGASDEIHQFFVPGRHADAWDVAKDFGGALLGAALLQSGLASRLAGGRRRGGECRAARECLSGSASGGATP